MRGTDAAAAVAGVEEVTITAHVGQPLPEGWQYLASSSPARTRPEAVEVVLRDAHARLVFEITPV